MVFKRSHDIPTNQEASTHHAPWIIMLAVFLLSLILAAVTFVNTSLEKWHMTFNNRITIEVPHSDASKEVVHIAPILQSLQSIAGVSKVEVVESSQLLHLLEPWVGSVEMLKDISLPTLIDIEVKNGVKIDHAALSQYLQQFAPGTRVESHNHWQQILATLSHSLMLTAYSIAAIIGLSLIITISLITRSGLVIHHEVIDTLRLIGANNKYIARQFQRQAFRSAFKGGVLGILFALPVIFFGCWLTRYIEVPELLKSSPTQEMIIIIIALPFVIAIISMFVARVSVLRTLRRMG